MSIVIEERAGSRRRHGKSDNIQFQLLYGICLSLFLIAAVFQRLLPWTWFAQRPTEGRQSSFEQARKAAGICATYAFME